MLKSPPKKSLKLAHFFPHTSQMLRSNIGSQMNNLEYLTNKFEVKPNLWWQFCVNAKPHNQNPAGCSSEAMALSTPKGNKIQHG